MSHRWIARPASFFHSMIRRVGGAGSSCEITPVSGYSARWRSADAGSRSLPSKRMLTLGFSVRNGANAAVIFGRAVSLVSRLTNSAGFSARKVVPVGSSLTAWTLSASGLVGSDARADTIVRWRAPAVSSAIVVQETVLPRAKPRIRPWPFRPFMGRLRLGETRAATFHEPPRCSNAEATDSGVRPCPSSITRTDSIASVAVRSSRTSTYCASASREFHTSSMTAATGSVRCARRRRWSAFASMCSRAMSLSLPHDGDIPCRFRSGKPWSVTAHAAASAPGTAFLLPAMRVAPSVGGAGGPSLPHSTGICSASRIPSPGRNRLRGALPPAGDLSSC